jgi:carbonic anhydrase
MSAFRSTTRWQYRAGLVLGAMTLAVVSAAAQTVFTYFGSNGPAAWGRLDPAWTACGQGRMQSPVDFRKPRVRHESLRVEYERSAGQILDNEHTIEIETEGHNVLELDGVAYELQQFHFHGLSEHTFEGKGSDMELHLVHKSADGLIAVVGVLLVRGATSGALAPIFAQLPNDVNVRHPLPDPFNPGEFLPVHREHYRYEGSLTTPPCTEGVHWIVLKDPITVSSDDLARYHERIHFNARPVQRVSR